MAGRRPSGHGAAVARAGGAPSAAAPFAVGTTVEYYSKSYDEWIPAVVNAVRPDGQLRLLHEDGTVLKEQADPSQVRSRAAVRNSRISVSSKASNGSARQLAAVPKRPPTGGSGSRSDSGLDRRNSNNVAATPSPPTSQRSGPGVPRPPGGGAAGRGGSEPVSVNGSPAPSSAGSRPKASQRPGSRSEERKEGAAPGLSDTINKSKFYVGDRAQIKESGRLGEVMYIGNPAFSREEIVGLRLDEKRLNSDCDGKAPDGMRFFNCRPGYGLFLPSAAVAPVPRQDIDSFTCLAAPAVALDCEEAFSKLVGLSGPKQQVTKIRQVVEVQKKREGLGIPSGKPLHFGFRGGRGTGMSTIARLLAQLLRDLEVVTSGQLLEVNRKELLAGCSNFGDAEKRAAKLWNAAAGGVVLVNDAHLLQDRERSRDEAGMEVSEFLAKQVAGMTQTATGDAPCWPQAACVILAAPSDSQLPDPLQRLGLWPIEFADHSTEELAEILRLLVQNRQFALAEDFTNEKLQRHVRDAAARVEGGKNLVMLRRLLDEAIERQSERAWLTGMDSLQDLTTLTEVDFERDTKVSSEDSMRAALARLDGIVGLRGVKDFVHSLYAQLKTEMERREAGINTGGGAGTLHMIFSGNPGTGKTTVARIVAELLTSMGLLRKGHLVEADRAALVAGYSGQTAIKTRQVVDQAMGGILFIDEAYALVSEDGKDSFGHEALDTLIKLIEDRRHDLVVILAGYPEEMQRLVDANPGVRSRFPTQVHFADYTEEELMQIAEKMLLDDVLVLSHTATQELQRQLASLTTGTADRAHGNGRAVRNILEKARRRMAVRLQTDSGQEDRKRSHSELCTLEAEDFE